MIQTDQRSFLRVQSFSVAHIADDAERVADHGDFQRMFADIFRAGAPHQRPSFNILHPGYGCKKMPRVRFLLHAFLPLLVSANSSGCLSEMLLLCHHPDNKLVIRSTLLSFF